MKNGQSSWEEYLATLVGRETLDSDVAPITITTKRSEIEGDATTGATSEDFVGIVFKNKFLTVVQDRVENTHGSDFLYLRLLSGEFDPTGVAILPITSERKVVLLQHYRHATGAWHWEIPRGYCDSQDSERAVSRELKEELGISPLEIVDLGFVYTNTGLMSERVRLFLAEVGRGSYSPADETEGVMIRDIREFSIDELEGMVSDGTITDSFTLAAILRARLKSAI